MMKTINNRHKDELVSGRGETNDVEATGMKDDRACAKFEMRRKCDGEVLRSVFVLISKHRK